MTKEKNKKTNPILEFEGTEIDLTKFNLQSDKEQYDEVKIVLQDIYKDNLYVYCNSNPVNNIDPKGNLILFIWTKVSWSKSNKKRRSGKARRRHSCRQQHKSF